LTAKKRAGFLIEKGTGSFSAAMARRKHVTLQKLKSRTEAGQ